VRHRAQPRGARSPPGSGAATKSGIILGLGENEDEVIGAMADLQAVGVEIVTLGQYGRPNGICQSRWWTPDEFTPEGRGRGRWASPMSRHRR
jgi:lipoate synthase